MSDLIRITLLPLGQTLSVPRESSLQDALFAHGVEFPCGGHGRCKGCRIRLLEGKLPVSTEDAARLTPGELAAGWRLACRAAPQEDLKLELAQWEAAILSDTSSFRFTPRAGLGVAVDVGTTTLVAQLLDLSTGDVRAVRTDLNNQARHGADIMSRIEFSLRATGQSELTSLIRRQVGRLIGELLAANGGSLELRDVVLVGNTAMHHLFCGLSVEPLASFPFEPQCPGPRSFNAQSLDWSLPGESVVRFLPCLGGFIGSDILAGLLATRIHESSDLAALVDLGTNGEIVVGNRERLLCASTAAGPAFEGARISQGMRAATGAISEVTLVDGKFQCRVLGHTAPRGLCASGLVDAVAAGLELGSIDTTGRIANAAPLELAPSVSLRQADIRELQLAKGAIAAGFRILLEQWGATIDDLVCVHLAGAFGNYINHASARRIRLLNVPSEKLIPAGNTALLGAKLALFHAHGDGDDVDFSSLLRRIRHVELSDDPQFQDIFVEEMAFPS